MSETRGTSETCLYLPNPSLQRRGYFRAPLARLTRPALLARRSDASEGPTTSRSSRSSRFFKDADGFTLPELVIAICLMGLIAMLVLPRMGLGTNTMSSASRQLIGMMRTLYLTASATKRLYRLYLDLDQQTYWAMVVQPDGERPPAAAGLAEKVSLPPEIRLMDVITSTQGKVATTRAVIQFTPGGRTERSTIHLGDQSGNVLTLQLNPLTGSVQILDRYADPPPPEPLTDIIKTAFFAPAELATLKSPSGTSK